MQKKLLIVDDSSISRSRIARAALHADLNGARNIAAKYRIEGGTAAFDGLPVNQPTVSDPALWRSG